MASFDGKIAVQSIQSTKPEVEGLPGSHSQVVDDDDEFFNKAQSQSRGTSFNLKKAPKWLQRPCGASFGFGGKVVSFRSSSSETAKRSMVHVSTFAIDDGIVSATDAFERALKHNDLDSICESKISDASSDAERADWKVIKNLALKNPRKHLVDYLGFSSPDGEEADGESKLSINGSKDKGLQEPKDLSASTSNRLSAFFESSADGDSFLSELAATKGAKTNNPFQLYSGSESESDRRVTRALLLGEFEKALDVCLQEDRLSDAFMIAICGGQQCIDKVQKAYFNRKAEGPNYLRLLACVVGKNLWDLVHNADLSHWKEIMATLCTYADSKEFPDLCEALGDRLDEDMKTGVGHVGLRKDASFCYLAGSKLEKVVSIWINDLEEQDGSRTPKSKDSSFSVYARSLQSFIEKVTVFREAIRYQDCDRGATQDWKLAVLYEKYIEYADLASAHGQLQIAKRYLDLVPSNFPAADVAKSRVQQATRKAAPQPVIEQPTTIISRVDQRMPAVDFQQQQQQSAARPPTAASSNPYAPASTRQNPYAATNGQFSGGAGYSAPTGYQPRQQPGMVPSSTFTTPYQNQPLAPPPRNLNASPSIPPPSKAANMSNWNDTPESFFKATTSRRGTPGVGTNVPSASQSLQPIAGHSFGPPPKSTPPPPKAPAAPLPSTTSTSIVAPQQPASNLLGQPPPTVAQVTPPYNAPPSAPPPNNRYAPAQPVLSSPDQSMISGANRQVPLSSNLYAPRQNYNTPQHLSQQPPSSAGGPPRSSGLSSGPAQVPPQDSRPGTAQSQRKSPPKYCEWRNTRVRSRCANTHVAPGDRSHIPPNAQPIYELLDHDMKRVKSRAPSSFTPQVNDTEKRLNILFDHLNNEDLLKADTVVSMVELSRAIQARDFEQAQAIHVEIMTNKTDECGHWMVSLSNYPKTTVSL